MLPKRLSLLVGSSAPSVAAAAGLGSTPPLDKDDGLKVCTFACTTPVYVLVIACLDAAAEGGAEDDGDGVDDSSVVSGSQGLGPARACVCSVRCCDPLAVIQNTCCAAQTATKYSTPPFSHRIAVTVHCMPWASARLPSEDRDVPAQCEETHA